jgi:hypothetical protein
VACGGVETRREEGNLRKTTVNESGDRPAKIKRHVFDAIGGAREPFIDQIWPMIYRTGKLFRPEPT